MCQACCIDIRIDAEPNAVTALDESTSGKPTPSLSYLLQTLATYLQVQTSCAGKQHWHASDSNKRVSGLVGESR